jgi:DNA-binding MarR family transcriptional regulator
VVLEFIAGVGQAIGPQDESKEPTATPFRLLYGLGACDPEPTVTALAAIAGLSLQNASRGLKAMRTRGWVEMVNDPEDTRLRRVRLTAKGDAIMRLIHGAIVDIAFRVVENIEGQRTAAHRKPITKPK